MNKFSKNMGATSKFWAPYEWHDVRDFWTPAETFQQVSPNVFVHQSTRRRTLTDSNLVVSYAVSLNSEDAVFIHSRQMNEFPRIMRDRTGGMCLPPTPDKLSLCWTTDVRAVNKNAFSLQLQPFEVLMWHCGRHKSNLAIAYVRLLAMLVNSFEKKYLSFFDVLFSDQDRMSSMLSVYRMKNSFPYRVNVRIGWVILLCFAGYLLCSVRNSVVRGVYCFKSSWDCVSIRALWDTTSCWIPKVGENVAPTFRMELQTWRRGSIFLQNSFCETFLHACPFWLRKIGKASHILTDVNIVCPDDRIISSIWKESLAENIWTSERKRIMDKSTKRWIRSHNQGREHCQVY